MSTGFSGNLISRRNFSPAAELSRTRMKFFQENVKIGKIPAEEFVIRQIIPDLKQKEFKKPLNYLLSRTYKKAKCININKPNSPQMKIMIQKRDYSSDEEEEEEIMKLGEFKVCVTPKGYNIMNSTEFKGYEGNIFGHRVEEIKSTTQNYFYKKQPNFDLEQEVNYVPSKD